MNTLTNITTSAIVIAYIDRHELIKLSVDSIPITVTFPNANLQLLLSGMQL